MLKLELEPENKALGEHNDINGEPYRRSSMQRLSDLEHHGFKSFRNFQRAHTFMSL